MKSKKEGKKNKALEKKPKPESKPQSDRERVMEQLRALGYI